MAVNLGKVGFVLKGEWSAVVTYDPLEVVLHEGKVYAAKRSSTNAQPDSSPADWMKWVGSPVITSSAITGGHAITITNADGTSETINVLDGEVTNEVLSETLNELIGDLANLTTTDKSNVVAAINELDSDVGELQEGMETKAEIDGYYEDLTAGSAEQLISSVAIPDNAPYNFRTSGGNADIGNRETDKLVGGTVVWNQQLKEMNSENYGATSSGVTVFFSDKVATVTASDQYKGIFNYSGNRPSIPNGHKVLCSVEVKLSSAVSNAIKAYWNEQSSLAVSAEANTNWQTLSSIIEWNSSKNPYVRVVDYRSSDWDSYLVRNSQLFDLTQMFGSTIADYIYSLEQANAGDGVAWFRKLFPYSHYAFSAGRLLSVKTSGHRMTGFNQLSNGFVIGKTWQNGVYTDANTNYAAMPDKIKCLPSTTYCIALPNATENHSMYVIEFDASGNWLRNVYKLISSSTKYVTFQTSNDAYMFSFVDYISGGVPASSIVNANVNISWDGERDGEYEAYEEHSYALDSDLELRGIPKLDANNELYYDGDTYEPDGTVTRRYGIVDLGTLTWSYSSERNWFNIPRTEIPIKPCGMNQIANVLCQKYITVTNTYMRDTDTTVVACSVNNSGYFIIRDTAYNDATAFKASLSGVYLVYELDTPTTESADPYQNPQVVNDWGTEEYVDTRDVPIPVGHETLYQANLKAKLEMAPNSPSDGDGDYIVRQTNGINEYVPLVIPDELPTMPSEDGSYRLKVTVTNGTLVLSWESIS